MVLNNINQLISHPINFNNLKRFLFIGYLNDKLIEIINSLTNLEELQLQFANTFNKNIDLNLDK